MPEKPLKASSVSHAWGLILSMTDSVFRGYPLVPHRLGAAMSPQLRRDELWLLLQQSCLWRFLPSAMSLLRFELLGVVGGCNPLWSASGLVENKSEATPRFSSSRC